MLHDAAREGDVEIPVFCYEPKLGEPVGACRMCLVEIEGIPKLQTSCSTPVREGMVVHTRTEQVKHAQSAVVEFLLVNHPLDCPVCDKGGECPLQDITQGWGPGKSRVIDEKRHFEKPIELSPLVAIDRERCILCYRCVRFSQEVSEDAELQLLERGDRTFVGTFDDRPYVAPFHGNITELCPVGALTNYTYRFRARPWDIEQAGSVCTLCPSQCNVSFTVRDEKVKRVLGRDNAEVDDGWLCDRGRYGFEMFADATRVDGPRLKGGAAVELGAGDRGRGRRGCAPPAAPGRGDRRRRLQRGGLPGPAAAARGARLAAHRLPSLARPRPRGAGPRSPSPSSRPRSATSTAPTLILVARHRPAAQLADPRPPHPQGDPPQRRPPGGRHRAPDRARRRRRGDRPLRPRRGRPLHRRAGAAPSAAPRTSPRRWPRACGAPARSSSSGASASPATATAPQRPARARRRARHCGQPRAPACSKSPTSPTPAACARPAASPTPARASARRRVHFRVHRREMHLSSASRPRRSARRWSPASSRAWSSSASTRCATSPTPRPGRRRSPPPTSSSASRCTRTRPRAKADVALPARDPRRERRHRHPPRRPPPARPPLRRPPRRHPPQHPGPRRPLRRPRPRHRHRLPAHRLRRPDQRGPLLRLDQRHRHRRPRHPLAGHPLCREPARSRRGRRCTAPNGLRRWPRPNLGRQPPTQPGRRVEDGAPAPSLALGTYRDLWAGPITELNPPLKFLTPQQRLEISPADAERLDLKSGDMVRVGQNGTSVEADGADPGAGRRRRRASLPRASRSATPTPCSTAARSGSRSPS